MTSNGIRGPHHRRTTRLTPVGLIVIVAAACVACTDSGTTDSASVPAATAAMAPAPEVGNPPSPTIGSAPTTAELPYAHPRPTDLTPPPERPPMVYVPNQQAGTVQVI